jgi:hypothetical protein
MNSDPRAVGERGVNRRDIIEALADIARNAFIDELTLATRTCLTCDKFDEPNELCNKYGGRPPAKVIAFGCDGYEDRVPF